MKELKKGDTVRILRPESYWYRKLGVITVIESSERYGISCRFASCNYQGNFVAKFSDKEVELNI